MKNIINTNYKPQHTPKDIYRFMSVFQTALKEEIQDKLSLFEVEVPLYSTDKIVSDIYEMIESRPITFGTATDNEVYSMYNKYDYWFRNELENLSIETNSGIFSILNYVKRDQKDYNHETLKKKEMHIELRYDGEYPDEKNLEVIKVINKSIINSVKKAYKKVHLRNIPDYKVKYLDFIEDSLDTNDIQNQVDALTEKYGMLTVTNVNVNRKREITSSDERYYALTTIWSPYTKDAHSIVKAGVRKTYEEIDSLAKSEKLDSKDEIFFAHEQLNKNTPNSIYVIIDIYRVIVNALRLAHIGEVIPETQKTEIEALKKKANIKHI